MTGGDRGENGFLFRSGRRLRCWRETILGRLEEVTVIVGVIRVSFASQIFLSIRRSFVKEVIVNIFGGEETGLELGVLGG